MEGISIVIISRGRAKLLEELINSVKMSESKVDFPTEIILVDSSTDSSKMVVRKMAEKYDVKYFYKDVCVSEKRNFGAEKAGFDIILFLDSDCIASENLLAEYKKIYDEHPDAAGAACPLEFVGESTWFWKVVEKTPYTVFFSSPKWGEVLRWSPTANFSVKKKAFLAVGGFDTGFQKNPGGEDVDLGLRLSRNEGKIYSVPAGVVYHSKSTWCSVKSMFKRTFYYGVGDCNLAIRDKENMLCRAMPRRIITVFFAVLLCVLLGFLSNPIFYWAALAAPFSEILLTGAFVNIFAKYKSTSFDKQIMVQLLLLSNELGYVYGCFSRRKPRLLNKQLIFFKPQMDGICFQNVLTAFIYCIFIIGILIMIGVVK